MIAVSRWLYLTCMKYRTIRTALAVAIAIAIGKCKRPSGR